MRTSRRLCRLNADFADPEAELLVRFGAGLTQRGQTEKKNELEKVEKCLKTPLFFYIFKLFTRIFEFGIKIKPRKS